MRKYIIQLGVADSQLKGKKKTFWAGFQQMPSGNVRTGALRNGINAHGTPAPDD